MNVTDAVQDLRSFYQRHWRFHWVEAEAARKSISIIGTVLTKHHKDQAYKHAESIWNPINRLVEVEVHLLAAYHLIVDSVLGLLAYSIMRYFPKDNLGLVWVHDIVVFVIVGALALHVIYVLYENANS